MWRLIAANAAKLRPLCFVYIIQRFEQGLGRQAIDSAHVKDFADVTEQENFHIGVVVFTSEYHQGFACPITPAETICDADQGTPVVSESVSQCCRQLG